MCGESILANGVLLIVFSGGLGTYGLKSEARPLDVPATSYEGRARPGRLGAAPHSPRTARAAHGTTVLPSPDKSSKWIGALRSSLMRDNYDYQSETLAPLRDTSGETSHETHESSGDTSHSPDELGQPSAQDYDNPTPRSRDTSPALLDRSSSEARPDVSPIRPVNVIRKNMYPESGSELEIPSEPVQGPYVPPKPPRRPGSDPITMPPRTAENAALIDEINEQFETKRRNYLESLYELEDQLRPVYARGDGAHDADARAGAHDADARAGPETVDRRGGGNHHTPWNDLDGGPGANSGSQPHIGFGGIRRYKVLRNAMEKFQPLVEDYVDNHPHAAAELIPWHTKPQKRKQDRTPDFLLEAHKMHNVKPTYTSEESSGYVEDRTTQRLKLRKDRSKQRSGLKVKTRGDRLFSSHHDRHKKPKSMYLESAELPTIDSDGFEQRYNSRRNAELLEEASDLLSEVSSPDGSPSPAPST